MPTETNSVNEKKPVTASSLTSNELNDWCPGCLLPDNIIIGNPSAKTIQMFKAGDKVLGSDGYFHKINEVMTHVHRGKIYRLRVARFGETTLTNEHPVLIVKKENALNGDLKTEWLNTEDLRVGDYVAYPIMKATLPINSVQLVYKKRKEDLLSKKLPENLLFTDEFIRFVGYFIAKGSTHGQFKKSSTGKKQAIVLTFGRHEISLVEDAAAIARKSFGLKPVVKNRAYKHTIDLEINSPYLAEFFSRWCGDSAMDKRVPHELMLLPPLKQRQLIKGLWRGDGFVNTKSLQAGYKTISLVLKEQLKILLLRQNIIPSVYEYASHGIRKNSYDFHLKGKDYNSLVEILGVKSKKSKSKNNSLSLKTDDYVYLKIRSLNAFDYEGPVYNFRVEDVNSYVSNAATLHNCGNDGIVLAVKNAIANGALDPHKTVIVSGIGCSSKLPHLVNVNGVHTLHGRAIPFAEGIKLANPELTVMVDSGDGDTYGIGAGHFVSAGRRNVNIKLFVHNNGVYALTKGQASPTLPEGRKVKGIPEPNINGALNPLALAILAGYTFVARTQSYNVKEQTDLMIKAIKHNGLALIDIQQGCPTYNPEFTDTAWFRQHLHQLPQNYDGLVHNPGDLAEVEQKKLQALKMILDETSTELNTGLFFQWENNDTFEDRLTKLGIKPPLSQQIADANKKSTVNLTEVFKDLSA